MPAVYIHIPFCKQKCKYCDFNSSAGLEHTYGDYVKALISEVSFWAVGLGVISVDSVYIGGGTPTILDPAHIEQIMAALRKRFSISLGAEISIEANPETVSYDKMLALLNSGINRVSIGFQSLDDSFLGLLGRKHSARQAKDAFNITRQAGFDNINVDLIYGVPGQTLMGWLSTLKQAVSLGPDHVSCYSLVVEPHTVLEREIATGLVESYDEDLQADMFVHTQEDLSEAGYEHYEISNYAGEGRRCRHNMVYWNCTDYIGFGLGAHSKIGSRRSSNTVKLNEYIKTAGTDACISDIIELSREDEMSEFLFLGLRKTGGVSIDEFRVRFGCSVYDIYGSQIENLSSEGLLEEKQGFLKLTRKGLLLGNEVFLRFI